MPSGNLQNVAPVRNGSPAGDQERRSAILHAPASLLSFTPFLKVTLSAKNVCKRDFSHFASVTVPFVQDGISADECSVRATIQRGTNSILRPPRQCVYQASGERVYLCRAVNMFISFFLTVIMQVVKRPQALTFDGLHHGVRNKSVPLQHLSRFASVIS